MIKRKDKVEGNTIHSQIIFNRDAWLDRVNSVKLRKEKGEVKG